MKKSALSLFVLIVFAGLPQLQGQVFQTGEFQGDEAAELMTHLLREHSYVFDPEQLDSIQELYRQFRELDSRGVPDWHMSRDQVNTRLSTLAEKILGELPKSEWLVSISYEGDEPHLSRQEPVRLPGDMGALIFKISSGRQTTRFSTAKYDMVALRHDDFGGLSTEETDLEFTVPERGTTWGLVSLKNVPPGGSTLIVRFRKGNDQSHDLPIHITSPELSRIRVNVVSDDSGEPTPSMVQLLWKKNGRDRKPGNAIDMGLQFDNRGRGTSRRPGALPGDLGSRFWWCVPGPFEMTIPPGEWEIMIRRGVEHVPVKEIVTLAEGEELEKTFRPRRWVDMRNYGWYSGDGHIHAQILTDQEASNIMTWIQAEDIHVANVVKMGDIFRTYFQQRGFGPDFRVTDKDFVLVPSQEGPRTHEQLGHTLAMNTTSHIRDVNRYFLYDWTLDQIHSQGGLAGYAHVLHKSFNVHRDMSINVPKGKIDFVELMQFGEMGTDLYYDFLNTGFKLTASAGSDVPWGGTVGEVRLYAYLGETPFSADNWFEAIRQGRTFVTNGPMIEFQIEEVRPGDELRFAEHEQARKLRVQARAWGDPERMVPANLQIVRHGEVIREALGSGQRELSLEFEVEVGDGFWMAARAEGSDGSEAHTTPIYVVREPLRFWSFEKAGKLIETRMSSLDEVETMVKEATLRVAEGKAAGDWPAQQLARQGDLLMVRVEEARLIYRELQRTLQEERALRSSTGAN